MVSPRNAVSCRDHPTWQVPVTSSNAKRDSRSAVMALACRAVRRTARSASRLNAVAPLADGWDSPQEASSLF